MRRFRSKRSSSRHPTPAEAVDALAAGQCLYGALSTCSGPPGTAGLRDNDDSNIIRVCNAHYGRLRTMSAGDLDRLERVLLEAFARPAEPAPGRKDGVSVVYTGT